MLLVSCTSDKKKGKTVGKVQSAPYELLVVADKEWLKTETGQKLVEVVEAPIGGLPQRESNFRVTYINPHAFNGTFKVYANILFVDVARKFTEPKMTLEKDLYAKPQVVEGLYAPTNEEFVKLLEVGKDFLWASASKRDFQQNVCVYALPLSETYSFEDMRDSVMKVNIPGDRDDRWMETDRRTVNVDDITRKDLVVVRGLWDMRNDAMGGPFVSYVYADTVRNRFLVVEGFVFAPDKKKRPIMRQLEAALQTVTFEDGK